MAERVYLVHVLVNDGDPGWLPFTYTVAAATRDEAISRVRQNVRKRSGGKHTVRHVDSARLFRMGDDRLIH